MLHSNKHPTAEVLEAVIAPAIANDLQAKDMTYEFFYSKVSTRVILMKIPTHFHRLMRT
jgi:hypothetical protein